MVAPVSNPSSLETGAERSPNIQGQLSPHKKFQATQGDKLDFISQMNKINKKTKNSFFSGDYVDDIDIPCCKCVFLSVLGGQIKKKLIPNATTHWNISKRYKHGISMT